MLLVATPERLSASQAVVEQLQYTFGAENPDRWWFITWALAPVVLLLLSASYLGGPPRRLGASWVLLATGAAVTLASTYLWPSVFLPAAVGVYCAFRARSDAQPSGSMIPGDGGRA
jgi:lipopolysaccharide export LptBFGC system permease protein LptF